MTAAGSALTAARVWQCRPFEALSVGELESIYRLRQEVFIVEQACAYLDADGYDAACRHLTAHAGDDPLPDAYARLLPAGLKYAEASIGRVLTRGGVRGTGLGRELFGRAVAEALKWQPGVGIRISAQAHLERFYAGFGFAADRAPHIEDGIPHVEMLRPAREGVSL